MAARHSHPDYTLLSLVAVLLAVGLVMVYSASAIWAEQHSKTAFYFLERQIVWTALGAIAMAILSRMDYNRLKEWATPLAAVTLIALLGALASSPVAGVRRWIHLGPLGFEPAELAKLSCVILLCRYLDFRHSRLGSPWKGVGLPLAITLLFVLPIAREPDLGTPALIFAVALLLLYIGGSRLAHIAGAVAAALPFFVYELFRFSYRRQRLLSFLDPLTHFHGSGYQLSQAWLALGSGGWFGRGIGGSELKLMHLPAPFTDFIFPILCEELGLVGGLALLALFIAVFLRGLRIARAAPDLFGTLLASGMSYLLCLQAFFNIAMSIGILPTKGIPLPFVSFGGSSLLIAMSAAGVLLSVSRQARRI